MLASQKLELRRSEIRQRLGEIAKLEGDDYSDEIRTEEKKLQTELTDLEQRHRSALIAEGEEAEKRAKETAETDLDPETRERIELRSKAQLTNYLKSAVSGKMVDGAEAELQAAAGVQGIPIEIFDVPEQRNEQVFVNVVGENGIERRAITPAPGTVGVNLDPIRPAVFAQSIAPRLGIDMPRVASGTFASGTITTNQSAAAKNAGR